VAFDLSVITPYWPLLARGLANTVLFSAGSIAFGLGLGLVLALGARSPRRAIRIPARAFVEVFRNTPFLIQVFVVYFVLPATGVSLGVATAGLLALSLFAGAYFSESIRGAIASVPRGQTDAARAFGMSYAVTLRRVVVPQMMAYLLPALTNNMIGVVKESSVLSIITLPEVTMATQVVAGETFSAVEAYTTTALLYWVLTAAIAAGMSRLERRTPTYRLAAAGAAQPMVTDAQ
jgi:polar amino acid transport system permease protein